MNDEVLVRINKTYKSVPGENIKIERVSAFIKSHKSNRVVLKFMGLRGIFLSLLKLVSHVSSRNMIGTLKEHSNFNIVIFFNIFI